MKAKREIFNKTKNMNITLGMERTGPKDCNLMLFVSPEITYTVSLTDFMTELTSLAKMFAALEAEGREGDYIVHD